MSILKDGRARLSEMFVKMVEFKRCLHWVSAAGTRLLFNQLINRGKRVFTSITWVVRNVVDVFTRQMYSLTFAWL